MKTLMNTTTKPLNQNRMEWKTDNPKKIGEYICRMDNAYIKMCYWDGDEWLDMWETTLKGVVKQWMEIPY